MRPFKRKPLPPQGVRLIRHDGSEVVCGVVYAGIDERSCHLWIAHPVEPVTVEEISHGIVAMVPAHTAVEFKVEIVEEAKRGD